MTNFNILIYVLYLFQIIPLKHVYKSESSDSSDGNFFGGDFFL